MTFYKNYEVKITESEQTMGHLNNQISNLKNEIEVWRQKFTEAERKAHERDTELFTILQEKDRVSNMVKAKNSENDELRTRYNMLEEELRQIQELRIQCQEQHNQINAYLSDINQYERKCEELDRQVVMEKNKNNDLNGKISEMRLEVDRVQKLGIQSEGAKNKEIEDMK